MVVISGRFFARKSEVPLAERSGFKPDWHHVVVHPRDGFRHGAWSRDLRLARSDESDERCSELAADVCSSPPGYFLRSGCKTGPTPKRRETTPLDAERLSLAEKLRRMGKL